MPSQRFTLMIKVINHIPETADFDLITLKGHLILEEELYRTIKLKVPHPEYIDKASLKFSQLMQLVKSYYFTEENSWIWGAVSKLNNIRNDYSHSLVPEGGNQKILEFIELVESKLGGTDGDSAEHYRRAIALVCAEVLQLHEGLSD